MYANEFVNLIARKKAKEPPKPKPKKDAPEV